ncbi:MAG: endonuclease III [Thermodesulfobacteriota bacterium]
MTELKVKEMINRLERHFGQPKPRPGRDPLSELIFTILSQNTSDVNRDRAFQSLTSRFSSWERVSRASPSAIASAIRPGGLANVKSLRIKAILTEIKRRYGCLSLDLLGNLPQEEVRDILLSFNGVGPKTVACVLLFSLGQPAFPVDTHVFRVAKRLGLLPAKATPERAHEIMERLVPPAKYYSFHINLIRLGRTICVPRSPRFDRCPLKDMCGCYRGRVGNKKGARCYQPLGEKR